MSAGAITSHIDVAQVALYVFWLFFIGLILYLRREDRREGYPVEYDRPGGPRVPGPPTIPEPKFFNLPNGETRMAPRTEIPLPLADIKAVPAEKWPGAPLKPTGDAMQDGVGPAAYNYNRAEIPEMTFDGDLRCVPMRVATDFSVEPTDPDPRGMTVVGMDNNAAGTVVDLWVDRAEPQIRYLEVETQVDDGVRRVLLPMTFVRVKGSNRTIRVASVKAEHVAAAPGLAKPDQVTQREEDRICSYYAGGHMYATPGRQEPLF